MVPEDAVARTCLTDTHFEPGLFEAFFCASDRVARIIEAAFALSIDSKRGLTGNELAEMLSEAWPFLLEGVAVPITSLRTKMIQARAMRIAEQVASRLADDLAAAFENPFAAAACDTEVAEKHVLAARASFYDLGAKDLVVLAPDLQVELHDLFDKVVKPFVDNALFSTVLKRESETAALMSSVADAQARISQAKTQAACNSSLHIDFKFFNETVALALQALQASCTASRVPLACTHVATVRTGAVALFNDMVASANAAHVSEAQRLNQMTTAPVSFAVARSAGQGFYGNGSTTITYNLAQQYPDAVCAHARNTTVSLHWVAGNQRSSTYAISNKSAAMLYAEHDGGRKFHSHHVSWDGTSLHFTLGSGGWGSCSSNVQHEVFAVSVTYSLSGLHGSAYDAPFAKVHLGF